VPEPAASSSEDERIRRLIDARQWDQVAEIGAPAVNQLIRAVKSNESEVRKQATAVLGMLGDERAVDTLAEALKDSDAEVRRKAAWALGKTKGERATESLREAMSYEHSDVRAKAASTLNSLGWKPAQGREEAVYLIAQKKWDRLAELGAAAEEPLTAMLNDDDAQVREEAQWLLNEIKSAKELQALYKSLEK
jgi:HEAT repeat protein